MGFIEGFFIGMAWYYIVVGILCVIGFLWFVFEESWLSPIALAGLIGVLYHTDKVDISQIDMSASITAIIVYFIIGMVWSGVKWFYLVKGKKAWHDNYLLQNPKDTSKFSIPNHKDYTEQLAFYIVFWPFSMIKYLLGDLVMDIARHISNNMGRVYAGITALALK